MPSDPAAVMSPKADARLWAGTTRPTAPSTTT